MTPPPFANAPTNQRAAFALAFVASGFWLCWLFDPLRLPFFADNQTFYFIAERAASGVPPHAALVNHKLALSMLMSGGAIGIGRAFGVDDVLAARLLSMTLAASTAALVWALSLRLTRSRIAAVLAGAVMLTFAEFYKQGAMGVRPQAFATFFLTLSLVSCADRKQFRSGVYAAAAFLCWQPAATVAVAVGVAAMLDRRNHRAFLRVCAGGIVTFVLYEAYFALHGLLGEQLYQSFRMGLDASSYNAPYWLDTVRFIMYVQAAHFGRLSCFAAGLLVAMAWWWVRVATAPHLAWQQLREQPGMTAALVLAHLALAFTFVDFQAFPDRFVLLPLYAVASGRLLAALIASVIPLERGRLRNVVAAAAILALVAPGLRNAPSRSERAHPLQRQRELAAKIDRLERAHGAVWAIGCVHLLGLARRDNFDRFGVMLDPRVRGYMQRETVDASLGYRPRGHGGEMPGVVLTARPGVRKALPWLTAEYRQVPSAPFARQKIKVWVHARATRDRTVTSSSP